MTPTEMIAEWRKGCSVTNSNPRAKLEPQHCAECTAGLISAIESALAKPPPLRLSWEDIRVVVEESPGLIPNPAALRARILQEGKITLRTLLELERVR